MEKKSQTFTLSQCMCGWDRSAIGKHLNANAAKKHSKWEVIINTFLPDAEKV